MSEVWRHHPPTVKLAPGEIPAIEYAERVFDFGCIRAGSRCEHVFEFKNTGTGTLEIVYVAHAAATNCEPPYTKFVEPGQTGEILASFSTGKRYGPVHKAYHVYTNVPGEEQGTKLEVFADLWQPLTWSPTSVSFGRISMREYEQILADRERRQERLERQRDRRSSRSGSTSDGELGMIGAQRRADLSPIVSRVRRRIMQCRITDSFRRYIVCFLSALAVGCHGGAGDGVKSGAPVAGAKAVEAVAEDWPTGSPKIRKTVLHMVDDGVVDHGLCSRWHENGNKEYEGEFVEGRKVGRHVRYHKNGRMWNESYYMNGERQGFSRQWDEAGRLRKEESYDQGKPHGTWTTWNAKGKIKWQGKFDHGNPVDERPVPQE